MDYEVAKEKAEELDKFLQDRLSEDDFKEFSRLFKGLFQEVMHKIGSMIGDE